MNGPEKTAVMIDTVQPVIHKIFGKDQHRPVKYRVKRQIDKMELVKKCKHKEAEGTHQDIQTHVKRSEPDIREQAFCGVKALVLKIGVKEFEADHDRIDRHGNKHQQGFPELIHNTANLKELCFRCKIK
jgi:hypothetical protein